MTNKPKSRGKLDGDEIRKQALDVMNAQKSSWEDGLVFVTEKVGFKTRELLRTLRKNYWGVFNVPIDRTTGRKKTWVPLTEIVVEDAVKNIDLDTKDINLRAKKPESVGLTAVVRGILRQQLDEMFFGEHLDKMERDLAINGTAVWKTVECKDREGNPSLDIYSVDLLNFYIDPAAPSIQETDVMERAVMSKSEFMSMDGWDDKEEAVFSTNLSRIDDRMRATNPSNKMEMIDVFEWWGDMPKSWITGKKKDEKELIPGHVVASGLSTNGGVVHLIEKNPNKKGLKPYEEVHYSKITGRWLGRGPAEKVMFLQLWQNAVVNIRINRSYIAQLGIFKIRKGAGITPQMVSKLAANGALTVANMDDIQQFVMQEASSASYADEDRINNIAQRVTSLYETATGEQLPASTPATNAVLQQRASASQFVFIKEGIGLFLQRWLKRHAFPVIQKRVKPGEVFRVTGDVEEVRELDLRVANHMLYKALKKVQKEGKLFSPEVVKNTMDRIMDKYRAMGQDRYVKLDNKIDFTEYDIQVFITNEEIDKAVLVTNLTQVLQMVGGIPGIDIDPADIVRQIFDVLGLQAPKKAQQIPQAPQGVPQGVPQGAVPLPAVPGQTTPTEQSVTTEANAIANAV